MENIMRIFGLIVVGLAIYSTPAFTQNSNHVGTLVCNYGANFGKIFGSRQSMSCVFHKSNGDTEAYNATLGRVGLDIGVTGSGRMAWAVLTATSLPVRALTGNYVGASGEASFGLGRGANVLIGGSKRTITLQPLSLDAQTGLNLAVGGAKLMLR
jgi:hypothetical protein